ncbi:MAG: hypothetical protein ACLRQF_13970 [Thomasclavelia ramosa]
MDLDIGLKYQAINEGKVDVMDVLQPMVNYQQQMLLSLKMINNSFQLRWGLSCTQ